MSQSDNVVHIGRHRVEIPPPLVKGDPHPNEDRIPFSPDWPGVASALVTGAVGAIIGIVIAFIVAGCGGSSVAQGAQKTALAHSAESCDDKATAIIEAGETCEGIVTALNKLVAADPKCASVFHTADPVHSCKTIGVQGKWVKEVAK